VQYLSALRCDHDKAPYKFTFTFTFTLPYWCDVTLLGVVFELFGDQAHNQTYPKGEHSAETQ